MSDPTDFDRVPDRDRDRDAWEQYMQARVIGLTEELGKIGKELASERKLTEGLKRTIKGAEDWIRGRAALSVDCLDPGKRVCIREAGVEGVIEEVRILPGKRIAYLVSYWESRRLVQVVVGADDVDDPGVLVPPPTFVQLGDG